MQYNSISTYIWIICLISDKEPILSYGIISLGVLGDLDIDINEGMQIELQGHIGRFQVNSAIITGFAFCLIVGIKPIFPDIFLLWSDGKDFLYYL